MNTLTQFSNHRIVATHTTRRIHMKALLLAVLLIPSIATAQETPERLGFGNFFQVADKMIESFPKCEAGDTEACESLKPTCAIIVASKESEQFYKAQVWSSLPAKHLFMLRRGAKYCKANA